MLCRDCGEKLSNTATFCPKCGARRIVVEVDNSGNKVFSAKDPDRTLQKPTNKGSVIIPIVVLISIIVLVLAYILSRPSGI